MCQINPMNQINDIPFPSKSIEEIAKELNLKNQQVEQIILKALRKLRNNKNTMKLLEGYIPCHYLKELNRQKTKKKY